MADNTPKDTSLQSTKQMLDELDALMERMLSLPVNEMDDAPAFPKEQIKGPTLAASLTLLEPPAPPAAPSPAAKSEPSPPRPTATVTAPLKKNLERRPRGKLPPLSTKLPLSTKIPSKPARMEALDADKEASLPFPNSEPPPLTNDVVPPTVLTRSEPLLTRVPESPNPSKNPWAYAPLLWVNKAFDRSTQNLGIAGRWLRSNGGRTLLGLSGIAMVLIAVGWVIKDWLGWNW